MWKKRLVRPDRPYSQVYRDRFERYEDEDRCHWWVQVADLEELARGLAWRV